MKHITEHYLYDTWGGMMQRCHNPNATGYEHYGGRGIFVCDEWKDSRAFIEYIDRELGEKPEGYTLDRIKNHKGYEPGNVRWADGITQRANQREPKLFQQHKARTDRELPKYVTRHHNKFRASFHIKSKMICVGLYDTPEEAHEAASAWRLLQARGLTQ